MLEYKVREGDKRMQKEESIIRDLLSEGYNEIPMDGESESERKRRVWKAAWSRWWEEWGPIIWKTIKIIGILVIAAIIGYILFWIFVAGLVLMAIGEGMSGDEETVVIKRRIR